MINRTQADAARVALAIAEPLEQVTLDVVTTAYRTAARTAHPDAGGTEDAFAAVDGARRVLRAWCEQAAPPAATLGQNCPRCHGAGHLRVQRGFTAMRVQCPNCQGSGELANERTKGTDE